MINGVFGLAEQPSCLSNCFNGTYHQSHTKVDPRDRKSFLRQERKDRSSVLFQMS